MLGICCNPHIDMINFGVKGSETSSQEKNNVIDHLEAFSPARRSFCRHDKGEDSTTGNLEDPWPKDMQLSWKNLFMEIEALKTTNFPRYLQPKDAFGSTDLHVFTDATACLVWPSPHGNALCPRK